MSMTIEQLVAIAFLCLWIVITTLNLQRAEPWIDSLLVGFGMSSVALIVIACASVALAYASGNVLF